MIYLLQLTLKQEQHGSPTCLTCCILVRHPQSVRLPSQSMTECLSWTSCSRLWRQIIYVARNAKDNLVSFFHFDRMNKAQPEPGDWSNYIHKFMQGKCMKYSPNRVVFIGTEMHRFLLNTSKEPLCIFLVVVLYGSWYDHVSGWWKKKQTYSKLHYMFYEDLIEDTGREVDKLCGFLGLSPSVEEKQRVMGGVQFDNMKKNSMANYSTLPVMDLKVSPFMRKGKVGDWKDHFTVAQNEEFDEHYRKMMKDPTLQFRTEI
uniref:cytosolic sulfotransferase 1-like isoform X3 n=1 Tax=Semicossyphus pulcher TaxID=241346 RepID=UPI0037E85831